MCLGGLVRKEFVMGLWVVMVVVLVGWCSEWIGLGWLG